MSKRSLILLKPAPFSPKELRPALWLDATKITSIDPVAASFAAATSESLSIADNTALSMGAVTMAMHAWVNLTTTPGAGAQMHIAGKWHSVTTSLQEYALVVDNTGGTIRFKFQVRDTGDTTTGTVTATTFGTPSTATWYSLWCYYDGANLGISVNDGAVDTAAWSSGILDSTSQFRIGSTADGASFLNGAVTMLDIWKSTVPTAAQVTALRNSGNGVHFSALPASIQVGQIERWELSEVSGTRAGKIGGYTLTDNNTVTAAAGVGTPGLSDGGVVSTWPDVSGNSRNMTQSTFALKPAFLWNNQNGRSVLSFDGVDDEIGWTNPVNKPFLAYIAIVARYPNATFTGNEGLFTGTTEPFIIGATGTTRWFTIAYNATSYRLNAVTYALDNAQAPMAAYGVCACDFSPAQNIGAGEKWLFGKDRGIAGRWWPGTVAAFLATNTLPSMSQRRRAERWLGQQWAIT